MDKPFNQLTLQQAELFALLAEECGEVVQIVGKILRHGLESYHPDTGIPNWATLQQELGDVLAAVKLLRGSGVHLDNRTLDACMEAKLAKVSKYLHHSSFESSQGGCRE